MKLRIGRSASSAAEIPFLRLSLILVAACVLAGCTTDGQPTLAGAQPRGATVAFDSIDGPPPGQFRTLVQKLNDEAQARQLAVNSRETPSAYRVRGHLAAKVAKGTTTISWQWDVLDQNEQRAFSITGEETAKGTPKTRQRDAWSAADDEMLRRIARTSVEQLAAFLTSPEAAPGESPAVAQTASIGQRDASPEAAGIFRIYRPNADPVATADEQAAAQETAGLVPLPRRRPAAQAAAAPSDTVTMAAASR